MPAATTPGLLDKPVDQRLVELVSGDMCRVLLEREMVAGDQDMFGTEPGSTASILWKLRSNAPETVSNISAIAISEMTRVERSQAWLNAALPVGAPA